MEHMYEFNGYIMREEATISYLVRFIKGVYDSLFFERYYWFDRSHFWSQ